MSRVQDYGTWENVPDPVVTKHAADRWDQRTPPDSVSPEAAWTEGCEMRLESRTEFRSIDEARYHQPTETVLLRYTSVIRTVLAASGPESTRIVRDAVANQFQTDLDPS
ncbi:hypothetical protein G9C85_02470 [Halorubellus sp. JP-L1]|uniref:hypothetical protein n=1 Tax=Halorubellus sp. JP-L1 TaxID=2715753 RepID=UPI00140A1E58|nr:hypothetical protein [Halorubellus sp. JP-L1]NHN40502.1 hypothetical protein [Halorubellus sp. JP-L1]